MREVGKMAFVFFSICIFFQRQWLTSYGSLVGEREEKTHLLLINGVKKLISFSLLLSITAV